VACLLRRWPAELRPAVVTAIIDGVFAALEPTQVTTSVEACGRSYARSINVSGGWRSWTWRRRRTARRKTARSTGGTRHTGRGEWRSRGGDSDPARPSRCDATGACAGCNLASAALSGACRGWSGIATMAMR